MKRFLLSCLAVYLCGLTSIFADDSVRAVQTKLKSEGFYFGEVSGTYDSDTASAVSRYQIRHGLPISGQIDPETAKALGVGPVATASRPDSASWQRLRKSDRRFLSRLNARQRKQPANTSRTQTTTTTTERTASRPPASVQADPDDPTKLILSRERLRDYVAAFVLAGLDPRVGAELEFFADRVNYYGDGVVDRQKIRRDLQRYNQQWPQRRFWLAGDLDVEPQPDSRLRVTFPLRYELSNGKKRSSGKIHKTLMLEITGEDLQIVGVNERKAR